MQTECFLKYAKYPPTYHTNQLPIPKFWDFSDASTYFKLLSPLKIPPPSTPFQFKNFIWVPKPLSLLDPICN